MKFYDEYNKYPMHDSCPHCGHSLDGVDYEDQKCNECGCWSDNKTPEMSEKTKVKIVFELDKESIQASLFFLSENLTSEMWRKITQSEIFINSDDFGEESQQIKIALSLIAISKIAID